MAKVSFGNRLGKGVMLGAIKKLVKSEAVQEAGKIALKKVLGNADLLTIVLDKIKPASDAPAIIEQLVQTTADLPEEDKGRTKALAAYVEKFLEGQLVDTASAVVSKSEEAAAKAAAKAAKPPRKPRAPKVDA